MRTQLRNYVRSFAIALVLTVLVGAVASVPKLSAVGVLLAPGMLGAAILFPEGTNSDWAKTYLVFAALLNAFLLAWPVLWVWRWIERFRERN
jgi:hypothetical protein